ncbi:MAG TPA: 16S rRNA (guanine(966)-N(2))-methyltransferase RsmD [Thermopetrobacter sp.]|nr:16S rRNA (guanine(966)-N(2))-methyltransferase RsmD [Thermopetrobacter sp.]
MRIVGGALKGRRIAAPKGLDVRPTTDRVRETVFNILIHMDDAPALTGARVIDLFAGSGGLGLEAASRGADFVLFVDTAEKARAAIRANVMELGLAGKTKIWRRDATKMGDAAPMRAFDIALLDPPYGRGLAERALVSLKEGGWLTPGALAVVEESARVEVRLPAGFTMRREKRHGDTRLLFAQMTA